MELTDQELEEQIALVDTKVAGYISSSPESEIMAGNQQVLHAEKQRRGKVAAHRAERKERQKTEKKIIKIGAQIALYGGPVLGGLGVGPIAGTFLYESGQGFVEGIEEQPDERKEALKKKFYDLYFKSGDWGDKWDFTKGYLLGIVEGIWGEIKGVYDFFKMLYDLNEKINDWLISTGISLFTNWNDVAGKGNSIQTRIRSAVAAIAREVGDFIKNPAEGLKKLRSMLDSLLGSALDQANELGRDAAEKAFKFLEQPFFELGEDIGKIVGSLIFNIVLLVASDAIGNLLTEGASILLKIGKTLLEGAVDFVKGIGRFITKAWELFKGVGKKLVSSETFEFLGKAIEDFVEWIKSLVPKVEPQFASASGAPVSGLEEAKSATTLESRMVKRPAGGPTTRVEDLIPAQEHPLNVRPAGGSGKAPPAPKTGGKVPPEPQLAQKAAALEKRIEFLARNKNLLGPRQQKWFEELERAVKAGELDAQEAARRIAPWEETIDTALKEPFVAKLNQSLPFPVKSVSRVPTTAAGEAEQLSNLVATGEMRKLSMTSFTKTGELIQLDGYDAAKNIAREVKTIQDADFAHLAPMQAEERVHSLIRQMQKGAEFARDYNLPYMEWEVPAGTLESVERRVYGSPEILGWMRNKIRLVEGVL